MALWNDILIIAIIKRSLNLRHIEISNNNINDEITEALAHTCHKLEYLDLSLLIQIKQARNCGPVLGEFEIGGSVTRANVYKNTIFENVDQEYYLIETNSYLSELPNNVASHLRNNPITQQSHQTEPAVQRWFNNLLSQFGSRWGDFVAKDTHDVGYLNGLMPDLSVFKTEDVADNACIPMLVKTIMELKRSTGFSNEEKGQLLDYLRVLTRQQPLLKLFAIFLSDGTYFYMMSYNRNINKYQEFETNFRIGLRLFYTFILRGSDYVRAFGSRSDQVNDRPAVIKIISDPNVLEREVEMLRFLNGSNIQNIPEYVAHDDKNIIIYPVCKRVDKRFQASHARGLLQVLVKIHSLKIYHRDVRPSNIMLNTENNSLILIDWGSAVRDPTGEVIYEGTSTYASTAIFNNDMGPYNPQSADDLHSFVRIMYVLLNPLRKHKSLKSNAEINNYWDHELNDRSFRKGMLTAVDENNIQELKKLYDEVLLIRHQILTPLFPSKGKVLPYANHLIEAANNATNQLTPYITIHWRMENMNAGRKKAQSSTFHIISEQHHDAIKLLNRTFTLNTWASMKALDVLFKNLMKNLENEIYGVLPFIAPEVLRYKPYTSASDIYSFSMIMWEFISGIPPFKDRVHDRQLYLSICNGERPEIIENAPQCYINLMKKCWNEDPLKRPNAFEIIKIFRDWIKNKNDKLPALEEYEVGYDIFLVDDFYDCPPKNRYSINNID
ncbi:2028_t:CDS:2 [Funneliformis geosporum]|uniref:2028_t:CDS:1 n=1 Tax=Funneliformis geosporum TaxID=1117311 RepID=A0A9W4SFT8_9GLOM|nr:2028_t:CDS:2 [Funneliformis geosporum]